MTSPAKVTVIGAGIVGIVSANFLRRDGHAVTVVDSRPPGEGCSFGNAGNISPGSCLPMAMPGVLANVPAWLFDSSGPLSLRLGYLPRALPWLARFARATTRDRVEATALALRALHERTFDLYQSLIGEAGAGELINRSGQLHLYETEEAFAGGLLGRDILRRRGVEMEELDGAAIRDLEPSLAPIFARAVFFPRHGFCLSPLRLVQTLAENFVRSGGTILRRDVTGFEFGRRGPERLHTDGGDLDVDKLVIAAGAWSGKLAARLGDKVPLEAERGYHLELPDPGTMPAHSLSWSERKFTATPMEMGLRFAGTAEFAGIDAPPDYRRSRILLSHGKRMLPGLNGEGESVWMGARPSFPDSRPVIGPATRHGNVFYAFGHSHTGLTGAPMTGKLIASLVAGRAPEIDLAPFRVDRF
jgi:D-amino-acid dehydrogenase